MAPFKLKFRMGGSRSTSQEHDSDPQVNEALLNHHQQQQNGTSTSTLDSTADCNSLASLGVNSERRSLLPNAAVNNSNANKTNNFRLGYLSHSNKDTGKNAADDANLPSTPPPSYEHVLEELQSTHLSSQYMHSPQRQGGSTTGSGDNLHRSRRSSANSVQSNPLEQIYELEQCTDPNCEENIAYNERQRLQREQEQQNNQQHHSQQHHNNTAAAANDNNENSNNINEARKSSIDSNEYLRMSTNMTSQASEEQLLNDYTGDCQRCGGGDIDEYENGACGGRGGGGGGNEGHNGNNGSGGNNCGNGNNDFCDPLMNHSSGSYYDNETHSLSQYGQETSSQQDDAYGSQTRHHQQHQQREQQQQPAVRHVCTLPPEVISNKSSKEIYKDLAKQWGITCKMSDGCRCMECQSHYFDCEFDDNEHQKTDGGLGAGTPMFISEVMHGSACHIL